MNAKRRKRRSRPTLRTRLRTFWIVWTFALAAVGYLGYALVTTPLFHLSSIAVTGLSRVAESTVVRRASIDPRANVWLLDRDAMRRRIEAIPYVLAARVHVRPAANVWIEVTERSPEGCVRDVRGRTTTVDATLRVLEDDCAEGEGITYVVRAALPQRPGTFLRDPELVRLQVDARALVATGDRYRSFAHDAYGELDATLASGIAIRFGDDDDLARKQRLIGPILAELGTRALAVRSVDLRAPSTPVVEYRPVARPRSRPTVRPGRRTE